VRVRRPETPRVETIARKIARPWVRGTVHRQTGEPPRASKNLSLTKGGEEREINLIKREERGGFKQEKGANLIGGSAHRVQSK